MTAQCGPAAINPGGCSPSIVPFWARRAQDPSPVLLFLKTTCTAGLAVRTLTTDKLGTAPAVGFTEADGIKVVNYDKRGASCEDPVFVEPCPASTPITVASLNCLGEPVSLTGLGLVQTVPHPTAIQLVKLCAPTQQDREMQILCAPDDSRVIVQNVTPIDAPLGTAPEFEMYKLDGTLYTATPITTLVSCASGSKYALAGEVNYCLAGVSYTRTDVIDLATQLPISSIWLNDLGNPVPAPIEATKGLCSEGDQLDIEIVVLQGCVNGVDYTERRTLRHSRATGVRVSELVEYVSDNNYIDLVRPAGFKYGTCGTQDLGIHIITEAGHAGNIVYTRNTFFEHDTETGVLHSTYAQYVDSAGGSTLVQPAGWVLGAPAESTSNELAYCLAGVAALRREIVSGANVTTIVWLDNAGNILTPSAANIAAAIPGACPGAVINTPGSFNVTGTLVTGMPVAFVKSLTLISTTGAVEYSTNGGATYTTIANGSRTWTAQPGASLTVANMLFRGTLVTSKYDVIFES
jgi:hypothetical protein